MIHILDDQKVMNGEIINQNSFQYQVRWSNFEKSWIAKIRCRDLTPKERSKKTDILNKVFKKRYIMVNPL